jgi:hypothetical protein
MRAVTQDGGRRSGRGHGAMVVVALLLQAAAMVGPAPAHADDAVSSSATATGLQATGLLSLPPTPTITATQPPDSGERRDTLLSLALPPLALSTSLTVVTEASRASQIPTPVFPELGDNALRRHVPERETNARAFSRANGLSLVLNTPDNVLQALLPGPLLSASAVEAVAIARCVDNQALFDTDFNVSDLRVLGQQTALDQVLLPLLSRLDVPGAISIKQGEAGPLPGGGVFINGLHISIPSLNVDIVVARSEVRMPTPCGIEGAGG